MRRSLALLCLALLSLAAAPGAASAAAEVVASGPRPFGPPALAGTKVIAGLNPNRYTADVLSLAPGGAPRLLAQSTTQLEYLGRVAYGGSADGVAAARIQDGVANFYVGPPEGPLTAAGGCSHADVESLPLAAAADGALRAWVGGAGECDSSRLLVSDGGAHEEVDAGGLVLGLAVAGRYVAWIAIDESHPPLIGNKLTVWDADAHAIAYQAEVPPPGHLDLQADGTVAMTTAAAGQQDAGTVPCPHAAVPRRVLYYTRAEPTAHRIPVSSCQEWVALAGGRVAFMRALQGGGQELALVALDGTGLAPMAEFGSRELAVTFDYDGTGAAWSQERCRSYALLERAAGDSDPPAPAVTCPVRVGRRVTLGRDRTLHVRIRCPHGCRAGPRGTVGGLTIVAPHWLHVRGQRRGVTRYAPYVRFNVAAGEAATLRIPLTGRQVRTLRRHGGTRARFKLVGQQIYRPSVKRSIRVP